MTETISFGETEKAIVYGSQVELEKEKTNYLLMDVDGCLIEGGLETAGNQKTLNQWSQENQENIEKFRQNIKSLQNIGLSVGLSTGRGLEFSKRLIKCFFPEESGINLDKSIVEGGLMIYDGVTGISELSPNVDKESADLLMVNRDRIMEFGIKCGGFVEEGKSLGVSFNPPIGENGKRDTDTFRDLLKKEMDQNLVDKLVITNSSTAVDITPKGVDKMTAMENLIDDGMVIYLGDGKNDETSMRNQKVKINLAPGNSHEDIKNLIQSGDKMGILAQDSDIRGTNEMLGLLLKKLS